jgi:hypothetical protein
VPSWETPLGDAPDRFIIKMVKLCGEIESRFLGGCPTFVWSAPQGLVVIHHQHGPPIVVLITSNANFDL